MRNCLLVRCLILLIPFAALGCKVEVKDDKPGIHVDREADGDREIHINTPRRDVDIEVKK